MTQKTVLILIAMGGCLGLGLLARSARSPDMAQARTEELPDEVEPEPKSLADDAATAAYLTQNNRGEALQWLNDNGSPRGVARWQKDEIVSLINDFYKAGAVKVLVVDTVQVARTEVASQFVVELPDQRELRKRIFDCDARFEAEYDEDPTVDSGQKYLHLTTD